MSYILYKNDIPTWAQLRELPHISNLPSYFHREDQRSLASSEYSAPQQAAYRDSRVDSKLLQYQDLNGTWTNYLEKDRSVESDRARRFAAYQRTFYKLVQSNPFLPFTLRGTVFVFSVVGLGLAAKIYVKTNDTTYEVSQQPSVIMALVVLTVALVYLTYSTYDEFFGQPLGLRSSTSKMTFVMVDLVFIIFASANLALAFNTLYDQKWVCQMETGATACDRQQDLVGVLFVSLCFWVITFGVSIYRMIDKAAGGING